MRAGPALLEVCAPATHEPERRYVLDVVLREWLGLEYELVPWDRHGVSIFLHGDARGLEVALPDVLFSGPASDWLTERSMPVPPLPRVALGSRWLDDPDGGRARAAGNPPVPILFAETSDYADLFRETPTGIAFAADIFGSVFYMLSRYEEIARRYRDEHDRYPAYASLASIEGFLERPVVDEYVEALWIALHALWPTLERPSPAFRLQLTHDVDQPWAALGRPAAGVLHSLTGDLIRRRDPALAWHRTGSLIAARAGRLDGDPYSTFDLLMDTSERHGLQSTFYFLAGTGGARDGRYRLSDPPIRRLLERIHARGHEIGLHASYGSYGSPDAIEGELAALTAACLNAGIEQAAWGVRQHYLRFEAPTTWRAHEAAGLAHDSSLGFADHTGFRAGTGREFPVYDPVERRPMKLRERPLVIMDATVFGYMGLGLEAAARSAREIVDASRSFGSDAVLCYHNSTLASGRQRAYYRDLIDDLVHPDGGLT